MAMSVPSDPQMGAFVAEYRANGFNLFVNAIIALVCFYLVITDLNMQVGYTIYVLGPVFRILLALLGLFCAYVVYARLGSSVRLYQDGFVYSKRPKVRIVRWTDVQKVNAKVTRQTLLYFIPLPGTKNHEMTITLKNGDRVEIDSAAISRAEALAEYVVRSVRVIIAARGAQAQ